MATQTSIRRLVALRLDSYEGEDTYLRCGDDGQDYLFAVVAVQSGGNAEIVDSSYRTLDELYEAWPDVER